MFHNRLTHSLQVAQVGRRIAEKLFQRQTELGIFPIGGIDPDTVEAVCLAHDLGHPPFGHVIEEELNQLGELVGGFEGNAQSFRIVTKLAFHSPTYTGLDLTRATLAGILKYPWGRGENPSKPKKWGHYESEKDDFLFALGTQAGQEQTVEAFLMDWADDITYSIHDLEDFYRAGRVPLHLLSTQTDDRERKYFFERVSARHQLLGNGRIVQNQKHLENTFEQLIRLFPPMQEYRGTTKQRAALRNFTGLLIERYVKAVEFDNKSGSLDINIPSLFRDEVMMLKELIWIYVIEDPALATQQLGQRHMVRHLFNVYQDAANSKKWTIFPTYYQERLQAATCSDDRTRACLDLIAGMTESQVYRIYSRLTGTSAESSLSDPLR